MVLSNNSMAAIYGDRVDKAERDRVIVTVFRLLCAVPPIVCALFLRSLTEIVDYAGECTFALYTLLVSLQRSASWCSFMLYCAFCSWWHAMQQAVLCTTDNSRLIAACEL
jgi:hypothetical protein